MDSTRRRQYLKICLHFSSIYLNKDKTLCILFSGSCFRHCGIFWVSIHFEKSFFGLTTKAPLPSLTEVFPNELDFILFDSFPMW